MVVTASLVLVGIWAALAIPETALAKKPGDDESVLNGSATFRDDTGDRVRSDGGPYYDSANGRKGDTILDLGSSFFRLVVKKNLRKNTGRSLVLDFEGLNINPVFIPANQDMWELIVKGTLQDWREQDIGVPVLRDGYIYFGVRGKDEARLNYGLGSLDGDPLTVTRKGDDVWTIESFDTDIAKFYRPDLGDLDCGSGPMPFKIDYDGTATSP